MIATVKLWLAVGAGWVVGLVLALLATVALPARHERSIYFRE